MSRISAGSLWKAEGEEGVVGECRSEGTVGFCMGAFASLVEAGFPGFSFELELFPAGGAPPFLAWLSWDALAGVALTGARPLPVVDPLGSEGLTPCEER